MTMESERLIAALMRMSERLKAKNEPLILTLTSPVRSSEEADELNVLIETLREATGVDVRLNFETKGES